MVGMTARRLYHYHDLFLPTLLRRAEAVLILGFRCIFYKLVRLH